ncbi:4-hydroxythreonine-4-phosphate dehydrogenase PdxA [Escherichia coli]|nr:4-hydroxythreonine-4-phosphate dehydrogenase PdxA [Escherichia coli]
MPPDIVQHCAEQVRITTLPAILRIGKNFAKTVKGFRQHPVIADICGVNPKAGLVIKPAKINDCSRQPISVNAPYAPDIINFRSKPSEGGK